jgi:hypothetical protein
MFRYLLFAIAIPAKPLEARKEALDSCSGELSFYRFELDPPDLTGTVSIAKPPGPDKAKPLIDLIMKEYVRSYRIIKS